MFCMTVEATLMGGQMSQENSHLLIFMRGSADRLSRSVSSEGLPHRGDCCHSLHIS